MDVPEVIRFEDIGGGLKLRLNYDGATSKSSQAMGASGEAGAGLQESVVPGRPLGPACIACMPGHCVAGPACIRPLDLRSCLHPP